MRALAAALTGFCVATLLGLAGGFVLGQLTPPLAWTALAVGLGTAVIAWRRSGPQPVEGWPSGWEWSAIILFGLASLRIFGWLVTMSGDEIEVQLPQNIGDLPKHWNYAVYLAQGARFWPENPHLAGLGLHYPIGVDLFTALLLACGASTLPVFIWMGLLGALAAGCALWQWGRGIALLTLLCNGGFLGWLALAGGGESNAAWTNLLTNVFATQRGYLYALPAGLLLLESWKRRHARAALPPAAAPALPFGLELLLYATMPFFHLHTFLFLSFLLGWWVAAGPGEMRRFALRLGLLALGPATALTWLVTDGFSGSGAVRWQAGWMQGDDGAYRFWIGEFGLFPLLAVLTAAEIWKPKAAESEAEAANRIVARAFVWPACLMFLLCAFVLFAPWEWDNIKLLLWIYLAIMPFLWSQILRPRPRWVRAGVCLVLFFAGFSSLLMDLGGERSQIIAQRSELDGMERALRRIPIEARFAAVSAYDHPLMFHGRKMTRAYGGHLLGHGLDWQASGQWNDALLMGGDGWREAARHLQADYIFWGRRERESYGEGTQNWRSAASAVAEGGWGTIYRLNRPEKSVRK